VRVSVDRAAWQTELMANSLTLLTSVPIALALGGGGARGIAHILALEAFDELGIKPARIAGTSAGALFGSAYASGLSAKLIRAHTEEMLGQRFDLVRQIFAARAQPISKLLSLVPLRNALLDPLALLDAVLPTGVARTFEALTIPLTTVACDFYAQSEVLHSRGELRPAVAASMALPVVFAPVMIEGRALVDGGFVNPLPFDVASATGHITVAIDVSGGAPDASTEVLAHDVPRAPPSAVDVMAASSQILQRSIVREKLKHIQPDVLIECPVDDFSVIDFHRWREVLTAAAPVKDKLKRQLDRILTSAPLPLIPNT
jgi:NTE family protein